MNAWHPLDDVDALGGRADLTVIEETGPCGPRNRHIEVASSNTIRIDAAELQVHPLEPVRRPLGNPIPTAVEPVNAMHATSGSSTSAAGSGSAGHEIDDARWKVRQRVVDHAQRRQGREFGGLDDDVFPPPAPARSFHVSSSSG